MKRRNIVTVAAMLAALTPAVAAPQARSKPNLADESSQREWDDEAAQASNDASRLKLLLRLRTHEKLALRAFMDNDPASAKREYEAALALDPHDFEAILGVADAAAQLDPRQALKAYGQAIGTLKAWLEAHPGDQRQEQVRQTLGNAYANRSVDYADAGKPAQALADLDLALELHAPRPAITLYEKSEMLLDLGRFQEASQAYAAAAAQEPDWVRSHGDKPAPAGALNICQTLASKGVKPSAGCE